MGIIWHGRKGTLVAMVKGVKSDFIIIGRFPSHSAPIHGRSIRKELYFAADSLGAFKLAEIDSGYQPSMDDIKTKAVHLPMSMGHQGVVVVASRSHQTEDTTAFIENLRKQGQPVTLISSGSSLKICLVAEGTADVYPRFAPTMEWDTAAGHAIARAAGCDVYHIDGKTPLKYNKEDLHNPWFIVKPL